MNRMIKTLCVILTALILAPLLFACNNSNNGGETSDLQSTTPVTDDFISTDILFANLSNYYVIYSDEASDVFAKTVTDFFTRLKNTLKTEMNIKTDFYKEGVSAFAIEEYEILIGDTNRPETKEFLNDCLRDEYGYRIVGKKIVICGGTEEATENAITRFTTQVLYKYNQGAEIFMAKDNEYFYNVEYPLDGLLLNGTAIKNYTIVYDRYNQNYEKNLAYKLQNDISQLTGYMLPVNSDQAAYTEGNYEILIGNVRHVTDEMKTTMENSAGGPITETQRYIGSSEYLVWLMGTGSLNISMATADFISKTDALKDSGIKEFTLEQSDIKSLDLSQISAMSFNIYYDTKDSVRMSRVVDTITNYLPDLLGIQEGAPAWMRYLGSELSDYYNYVGVGREGGDKGEYNAIFYAKDKFDCLESGTKWLSDTPNFVSKYPESSHFRILTYAILQRKDNGTKFLYINTHLNHENETARDKQVEVLLNFIDKYGDLPTIITGDFNAKPDSNVYKRITDSLFVDSRTTATEKINEGPTFPGSKTIIDYCFLSINRIIADKYKVVNETINGDYPSDHYPVYCEFTIAK